VVSSIINGTDYEDGGKKTLRIGVDMLPKIAQDTTDRNRTSPMAFTGNKFEFRMLGSAQSISGPNIALNTIMAEELSQFAEVLEGSRDFELDLQKLIKKTFTEHQRIIFNGNGYDEAWVEEAEKRGLSNLVSTADALPEYASAKAIKLFTKNDVYTEEELTARATIHAETYASKILIEASTMADMAKRQIMPAVSAYAGELCQRIETMTACGCVTAYETETANRVASFTDAMMKDTDQLDEDIAKIPSEEWAAMKYAHEVLLPDMEAVRASADALEALVDKEYWPFPVYSDLLFSE
jgi:glutamine synthetase